MKEYAIRLEKGADLKSSISDICIKNGFDTVVILSGVGSVYEVKIRLAGAEDYLESKKDYEIVSITGTVSKGRCHIHISFSDEKGNLIGGHLEKGCLINTTCELVFGVLEQYTSDRLYDEKTGFDELVLKECKK